MRYRIHQQRAVQRTVKLVLLSMMGIGGVVVTVPAALTGLYLLFRLTVPKKTPWEIADQVPGAVTEANDSLQSFIERVSAVAPRTQTVFFGLMIVTLAGILLVVLAKLLEYRRSDSGARIAESMGGVFLVPGCVDLKQRRLLNIVEEIAIASGVPVPAVYLIGNPRRSRCGINAFVAGNSPRTAVISVTHTALDYLNREELQGVIAHEFSHLLHEDMRQNMKTICWIHGISSVGTLGAELLQMGWDLISMVREFGAGLCSFIYTILLTFLLLFYLVAGAGLWAIGLIGVLCGNLMGAAIGRTREYLADASAVAFIRNPTGLASALRKIAVFAEHGRISGETRSAMNFLFFVNGVRTLLSSHPPVRERIRRLEGDFGVEQLARMVADPGRYLVPVTIFADEQTVSTVSADARRRQFGRMVQERMVQKRMVEEHGVRGFASLFALPSEMVVPGASPGRFLRDEVMAELLRRTRHVVAELPSEVQEAARDPWSARALLIMLLTPPDESGPPVVKDVVAMRDPVLATLCGQLREPIASMTVDARIVLMDLVLRTLRMMAPTQKDVFLALLELQLGEAAQHSLAGGFMAVVVRSLLGVPLPPPAPVTPKPSEEPMVFSTPSVDAMPFLTGERSGTSKPPSVAQMRLMETLRRMIGILALQGTRQPENAVAAFQRGIESLQMWQPLISGSLPSSEQCAVEYLPELLGRLVRLAETERFRILQASLETIAADGIVSLQESLLLRMIGAALDLPIPLLLPDER